MMNDIFSSFDPENSLMFQKSSLILWSFLFLPLTSSLSTLWVNPPKNLQISQTISASALNQTNQTQAKNIFPLPLLLPTLFPMLISYNLLGMIPNMFSMTSHLIFTVSLGLLMWLSSITSSSSYNTKMFTANFTPAGAPLWLAPPLILIETVSTAVRPLTLSVRLAANMSAGHIVLTLMSTYNSTAMTQSLIPSPILTLLLTTQMGYILFEFGICLIQAYIFFLLLTLYTDEHPPTN